MLVIHRSKGKIVKGDHHLYTKDEADDMGIIYRHWRHGRTGDWVISDDDWVLELLDVREYFDGRRSKISRYDVHTVFYFFGCARTTSWARNLHIHKHLRGMGALDGKTWQERFIVSRKGRRWIKLAAAMMMDKNLDIIELGEFMGFDKKYPDSTTIMVKRYLRDRLIENAIIIQMSQYLKDQGITADSVIKDYKEVLEKAKKDGKYNDAIKILDKFERWTGLDAKITGDKIEHGRNEDIVGSRIEKMIADGNKPQELIGGGMGVKVPASATAQVTDGKGKRVEYVDVEVEDSEEEDAG